VLVLNVEVDSIIVDENAGIVKLLAVVSKTNVIEPPLVRLVEFPSVILAFQVETAPTAVEPGVKDAEVGVVEANAGVAISVRPASTMTALKAAFTHT
jgi:hypothetical protein